MTLAKLFLTPAARRWIRAQRRPQLFRRLLRPADVFLVGHPKSGNTWLAYMLAILLSKDKDNRVTLSNVGDFVPYIHGQDLRLGEHWSLPDPRILRNECPIYPDLYPKVIYLVRDPRAVLVSFYHMYRIVMDDTRLPLSSFLEQYLATDGIFLEWNRGLVRWDKQVLSWTQQAKQNPHILIVKYENLVRERRQTLEAVVKFSGISCNETDLDLAVERGSYEAMRKNEEEHGAEAYRGEIGRRGRFVRRGEIDGWNEEMGGELARTIESAFAPAMRATGYL